jgi:hypothetical protein
VSFRERFRERVDQEVSKAETSARKPIDPNSFHYKIYQWYLNNGGRTSHNIDSLCPYMRIVLLWAPLLFLIGRPFRVSRGSAFMTILLSTYISVYLIYKATNSMVATIATIAIFLGFMGSIRLMYLRNPHKFEDRTERFLTWFLLKRYLKVIFPWMVAILAGLSISYLIWGFISLVTIFWIAVILLAFLVASYVLLKVLGSIWHRISNWWFYNRTLPKRRAIDQRVPKPIEIRPTTPVVPRPERGPSLISLIIAYIMAKERKICPYLQLPGKDRSEDQGPIRFGDLNY